MSTRTAKDGLQPVDLASLETLLGHTFADRKLLETALVHSSAATEGDLESNQTLEFLGDAVLDLAVSEFLLRRHPSRAEGELTRMRASIVSAKSLGTAAGRLELGRWIRLGRGEARSGGGKKANILADTYEALVAAVFLDGGYEAARRLIEATFAMEIAAADPVGGDFKTELQELTQNRFRCTPTYSLVSTTGPDHAKHFVVAIRIAGDIVAQGEGANRKSAEQEAAQQAIRVLNEGDPQAAPVDVPVTAAPAPRKRGRSKSSTPSDEKSDAKPDAEQANGDAGANPESAGDTSNQATKPAEAKHDV